MDTIYAEGPAALRREPQLVRPAVPRPDAEAEGRAHRRPLAGHRHRAEDHGPDAALDRRHGHRDLRLPPHPLRPPRPAALPRVRHPDRHADGRRDHRQAARRAGRHEAVPDGPGRSAGRREVRDALGIAPRRGLRPRAGRRRDALARHARRRSTTAASTRSRSWSTASSSAATSARGSPAASRTRSPSARAWCTSPIRTTTCRSRSWPVRVHSQHLACEQCGRSFEHAQPAQLLVQQPARLVPGVRRPGHADRREPGRAAPRPEAHARQGRAVRLAGCEPRHVAADARRASRRTPACRSTRRSISSRRGSSGSSCTAPAKSGFGVLSRRRQAEQRRRRARSFRFQFKGLYPALDEASQLSPQLRGLLDHLVDEVACSPVRRQPAPRRSRPPSASATARSIRSAARRSASWSSR